MKDILSRDDKDNLSNYEDIEIKLNYKEKFFTKKDYEKLLQYNVSNLKIEGKTTESSIIIFDTKKILECFILSNIEKNSNNIYETKEVLKSLKQKLIKEWKK